MFRAKANGHHTLVGLGRSAVPALVGALALALASLASSALVFAPKDASAAEATEPATLPSPLEGKVTGPWAKADGALRRVVAESRAHQERGMPEAFEPSNTTLQYSRGRIVIDAVGAGDAEVLLEDLRRLGLQKAARYGAVVSGSLPIGVIAQAVRLESLRSVAASRKPLTNVGWVTSEGVKAMYADSVHIDGFTGAGVTVGVLSDSYDQQGGASDDENSGDLPAGVTVLDDSANCGSPCLDEGRAMMQLAYDVAPEANFAFHTAFGGMADFANGIEELAAAGGADIIVDDVIYFAEPMFQDGIVARAVDNVVGQGVAYFSSAGNFARKSYESAYVASGESFSVNGDPRGQLHDFDPEVATDWAQSFTIPDLPDSTFVTIVLQWDEPFASVSTGNRGSSSDVDIYLLNAANDTVLASSIDDNILSGEPIEILQFRVPPCSFLEILFGIGCVQDPGTYNLLISLFAGPQPGKLKYIIFQHDIEVEYPTHSSTLYGHANAAGAEAVGAAFWQETPAFGVDPPLLEWFSSAGGTATLFENNGQRLDSAELRRKPEVVGPDGTNTTFFYADTPLDIDDWPNFFGTSASAPHVAGVGALMLHANPELSPGDMYAALEGTALNMNLDGFDFDTGYGFVQADFAVAEVAGGLANLAPVAVDDSASTDEDTPVAIDVLNGGTPDSDPDGDTLSVASVTQPANGSAVNNGGGIVTYTPNADFNGTDSFKYRASDGSLFSNEATVTVTVSPVNDPPVANDDSYQTDEDTTLVVSPGVLANDSDPENDSLTVSAFDAASANGGTVAMNADGSFTYTPAANFNGSDSFTYTVSDGNGGTDTATVTVTVNAVGGGQPPVASFTYTCDSADFTCDFDASASVGGINTYAWAFGDGSGGSGGPQINHPYSKQGSYTIVLIVTDNNDQTGTASTDVRVPKKGTTSGGTDGGGGDSGGGDTINCNKKQNRELEECQP